MYQRFWILVLLFLTPSWGQGEDFPQQPPPHVPQLTLQVQNMYAPVPPMVAPCWQIMVGTPQDQQGFIMGGPSRAYSVLVGATFAVVTVSMFFLIKQAIQALL